MAGERIPKGTTLKSMQKLGGIGGFAAAATFVVGVAMFATMFLDFATATDPTEALAFLADNQVPLYIWNNIVYIVFGIVLVPFTLALADRLGNSPFARVATVFGLIWSGVVIAAGMITNITSGTVLDLHATDPEQAATVWITLEAVRSGLGGGNEVVGAVWVLLASLAGLATRVFPRWLNYLGVVMGVAGLVTVIPPLEPLGVVFGLGTIVWFTRISMTLVREPMTSAN
jgi:MFS family permease